MTDEIIADERSSLLAAFARSPEKKGDTALVTMAPASPLPVEQVVGAQKVAVYRDEQRVLEKIRVLASAAGSDWYYRFPVKTKSGGQDWIEGASVKLANDIARLYGNCSVDTRVTDLGDSWLIYARFYDLESGFTMTRPFQQRKGQRGMRGESDRMLDINLQIGASKAIRNVIVNSLQSIADFALEEARNGLIDKVGKNLENYRKRASERLKEMQIELQRVEHVIGRPAGKWTAWDIAKVIAMIQSINDGMTTADDSFPELGGRVAPSGDQSADELPHTDEATSAALEVSSSAQEVRDSGAPREDGDPIQVAFERGQQWKKLGHHRTAIPGEYRTLEREEEAKAWFRGWDGAML